MDNLFNARTFSTIWFHIDDIVALLVATPILVSFVQHFYLPPKREPGYDLFFISPQSRDGIVRGPKGRQSQNSRDISEVLSSPSIDGVVLWGSQSGNSERLAKALAKLLQTSLGFVVTADDLDNYNYDRSASIPPRKFVGLVLATYGEGDPPDNAVSFDSYLATLRRTGAMNLENLQYFVFGLGSSKYQHFNRFAALCDESLRLARAKRIGYVGYRDEVLRSDESWNSWSADLVQCLSICYGRQISVADTNRPELEISISDSHATVVEPFTVPIEKQRSALKGRSSWFQAPIIQSKVLYQSGTGCSTAAGRTYVHVEFDCSSVASSISYEVGDHLAIWPKNTDSEVARVARAFGWDSSQLSSPIKITTASGGSGSDLALPSVTTREALLRHYLDICGPPTQESIRLLTHFAPNEKAKNFLSDLLKDDQTWRSVTLAEYVTLGRILEQAARDTNATEWSETLFPYLLQSLPRLQPRYFSIASAPKVHGRRISVTVGLVATALANRTFIGLLSTQILHTLSSCTEKVTHQIPMHIRTSNFRLPDKTTTPIIMVAAGSGVAPFLAFAHERRRLLQLGHDIGQGLLFYGCHSKTKDFLYEEEWGDLSGSDRLEVDVAESRATGTKVYVQDRIQDRLSEVRSLITDNGAAFYICGSVKMAMGVKQTLIDGFVKMGLTAYQGQEYLARLKKEKSLQEDVWA